MIDTGAFIFLERQGYAPVESIRKLREAAGTDDLSASAIAYTEVLHGIYRADSEVRATRRRNYFLQVFSNFPVRPYTRLTAEVAAKLRGEQMRLGNTLPFADSLIAATALAQHSALLTQNITDFERVPGLRVIFFPTR